jgi:hypothetical protein
LTSSTSSSERSGYSWKRLGLQFACVLVAFAALNVVVYYNNEYFEKARGYHELVDEATHRPNVRILFAGDSHLAHPLNAYLNDNPNATGFSVAFGGDSAREMFAKVRRVLESSKKVDTLALSVDPHMFGSGRIESSNRSFSDRYFLVDRDSSGLRQGWLSALLDQVPLFNNDFVQYLRKAIPASLTRRHSAAPRGDAAVSAEGEDTTWQSLSDAERARQAPWITVASGRRSSRSTGTAACSTSHANAASLSSVCASPCTHNTAHRSLARTSPGSMSSCAAEALRRSSIYGTRSATLRTSTIPTTSISEARRRC